MEDNNDRIKLTSAELSYLWNAFLADSMSVCVFLKKLRMKLLNHNSLTP